jgi:hypothetical protein
MPGKRVHLDKEITPFRDKLWDLFSSSAGPPSTAIVLKIPGGRRRTHALARTKTLSIQRPRPSIEMRMSASFKVLVKAKLVNCEP